MKRFRGTLLLACSIIIILLFTPLATVEAAAGWIVVPSANPGTTNVLNSVSWQQWTKVGWAVGSFQKTGGPAQTLTETWNGSAWITVSSPNMGLADALNGVTSVIGTPDFWAVGYWINGAGVKQTLTEQYTGEAGILFPVQTWVDLIMSSIVSPGIKRPKQPGQLAIRLMAQAHFRHSPSNGPAPLGLLCRVRIILPVTTFSMVWLSMRQLVWHMQ